jgi:hypothetical protein
LLSSGIASVFTDLINLTGILYGAFYALTALAAIVYYRRRVFTNVWDGLLVGILPFAAAGFLAWMVYQAVTAAPASQNWTLVVILAIGVVLLLFGRFVSRSNFYQIKLEAAPKD